MSNKENTRLKNFTINEDGEIVIEINRITISLTLKSDDGHDILIYGHNSNMRNLEVDDRLRIFTDDNKEIGSPYIITKIDNPSDPKDMFMHRCKFNPKNPEQIEEKKKWSWL